MKLKIYQVDAFTENNFGGNPAAVIPLDTWLSDQTMQLIAEENNLSETAFFVPEGRYYHIRWFTPNSEVELCGHATLAAAFVIFNYLIDSITEITFKSLSGLLSVKKLNNILTLDFPSQSPKICNIPKRLVEGLGKKPESCLSNEDYLAIYKSENDILNISPDFEILKKLDLRGVIITAPGKKYDFVSRAFYPKYGILEDPVTGSAHTQLIPYWADIFGKLKLNAKQISKRSGELLCEKKGDRVLISGYAKIYMIGEIEIG